MDLNGFTARLSTLCFGLVTSEKMLPYVGQKGQAKSKLGTSKASLGFFEPYVSL